MIPARSASDASVRSRIEPWPRTFWVHLIEVVHLFLLSWIRTLPRTECGLPPACGHGFPFSDLPRTFSDPPRTSGPPGAGFSNMGREAVDQIGPFRLRLAPRVFRKTSRNPLKTQDVPRTKIWTFRVQQMDLPRTSDGPSAYLHRTFHVPLNRKQEKQEASREREISRWLCQWIDANRQNTETSKNFPYDERSTN
jgi:hypothetical protein